jgi:hypothetical protein
LRRRYCLGPLRASIKLSSGKKAELIEEIGFILRAVFSGLDKFGGYWTDC